MLKYAPRTVKITDIISLVKPQDVKGKQDIIDSVYILLTNVHVRVYYFRERFSDILVR